MEKPMQKYLVLIKLNPAKTESFYKALNSLSERPIEGVRINSAYNVFGEWDFALWFEADSNDNALHFVGDKIRPIEGIMETHTMPTTVIKEYRMR